MQSPSNPFFVDKGGVATGFNIDFMKLLFAQDEFTSQHSRISLNTDTQVDVYENVPKTLLKKDGRGGYEVDIAIDGLTFVDGDVDGVVYTIPYVSDFGYSLIAGAKSGIQSVSDLDGLTIGVLMGDSDVMTFAKKQFPNSKIVEISDASTDGVRDWIPKAIKSGKVDAMIYDYPFGVAEIAGTDLQFVIAKLPNSDIKYKIGVREKDAQLLEALNIAIRKVRQTPEYTDLLSSYFMSKNVSVTKSADTSETAYTVKQGDTLSTIASSVLGDKMRYREIESRNNLPNPNFIQVGQKLVIPKK